MISNYFHPEPAGSAPPITDLALWLAENGYAPRVLTARPSYPDGFVFDGFRKGERDREVWRGVTVRRFDCFVSKRRGLVGRVLSEASYALALILHRLGGGAGSRFVISVCPTIFAVTVARWFASKQATHLAIVHDIQSGLGAAVLKGGFAMKLLRWLERSALNRVDVVVALSEGMARQLRDLGVTRPIEILPPQIDAREVTPVAEPEAETPLVLYSGALGRKQGLEQVVQACAHLMKRRVQARVVIRGQGGILEELRQQAKDLDLDNLTFEPLRPRSEFNAAMAEAAIHLVPQIADGQDYAVPSKVFSIMAAGRPFVGTALADSPLGVLASESQGGILAAPGDPGALAEAIEGLLGDRDNRQRMGAAGRHYVERHADREVVCRAMARLLESGSAN